jgi:NAD(P)-dependent dehydrogenase (short-subunit alcohol dehydrogenase family)
MVLTDKVAIVTGSGGTGSGRAIARALAREGALVVVTDVNRQGAAETVSLIHDAGGRAEARVTDMQSADAVQALIASAATSFGRLDVLVNCASSAHFHPDRPLDFWDEIIGVDLQGTLWAARAAIDVMCKNGGGAIVNFSSTSALAHGRLKGQGSPAYDIAKAGIIRLTTMLGFLGAKENIRVNCIAPDWIAVPELQRYYDSLTPEERVANGVPTRLTTLDEIAEAAVKLATDEKLHGRVLVWWSDKAPALIPWGDPGYASVDGLSGREW